MKQCPTCQHIYTDETLIYCLDDGATLYTPYDPQATQHLPGARPTAPTPGGFNFPPYSPSVAPQPRSNRWLIYLLLCLVLVGIGIGVFALVKSRQGTTDGTQSSGDTAQSKVDVNRNSLPPAAAATPTASQLVGTWRANINELGNRTEITYTVNADGTTKILQRDEQGRTATESGTWQYSDGTLFERFANGSTGKGSIRWIDRDTFEITIIDNGVPAYNGLKRTYHRVS